MSDVLKTPSVSVAQVKKNVLLDLVADGQRALGQGRAEDALRVALSVLESDEDLAQALALQGDALERLGKIDEALAVYERIIELNPDSPLDRIRAAHLKKLSVVQAVSQPDTPNRRGALMAAIAATVLATSAGAAFYLASQGQSTNDAAVVDPLPQSTPFNIAPIPKFGGGPYYDPNAVAEQPEPVESGLFRENGFGGGDVTLPGVGSGSIGSSSALPNPGQDSGLQGFVPVSPTLPGGNTVETLADRIQKFWTIRATMVTSPPV
jgi:hypothetical protein